MPNVQSITTATDDRHAEILATLLRWAERDSNIRAVIQTGSTSRPAGSADRFSDLDIELICNDPAPLISDDDWIHNLALVWVALYLDNGPGEYETRLVFFEGARKVDFTLADIKHLQSMLDSGHLNDLYDRGYQVLMDKDGLTGGLSAPTGHSPHKSLPSELEFTATVTEFWFEAAHMPTYLTRDDLWVVKLRDGTIKDMLLCMLEWHALYSRGSRTDVWYRGTKLKRWIDPETWDELHDVFGKFDAADSYRSLLATMRLFTRLTHEIASMAGFAIPESESHIQAYVLSFADAFQPKQSVQP
jgi:aminoglycoside 6-adenylyltransferase